MNARSRSSQHIWRNAEPLPIFDSLQWQTTFDSYNAMTNDHEIESSSRMIECLVPLYNLHAAVQLRFLDPEWREVL